MLGASGVIFLRIFNHLELCGVQAEVQEAILAAAWASWGRFGEPLDDVGSLWGNFSVICRSSGGLVASKWRSRRPSWLQLGRLGIDFGSLWAILGASGEDFSVIF